MPEQQRSTINELQRIEREDHLREILMNLFDKMGLDPTLTHGSLEYGKDIICSETTKFGIKEWIAAVVKVGKIIGGTSGSGSLQTVINQVQESFQHPYKHPVLKQEIKINKVLVITNHDLGETAREKFLDKLSALGPLAANVHFLSGARLSELLDLYWPDFSTERADVMGLSDPMSDKVGLVLYLMARAYILSQGKSKKIVPADMSLEDIVKYTRFEEAPVQEALQYLLKTQYLEKTDDHYTLHRKLTRGRLLTNINQIQVLFAIEEVADRTNHFALEDVNRIATKRPLNFRKTFVKNAVDFLVTGGYVEVDEGHGKGHFTLNINMLRDEREYLACWLKFRTGLPSDSTQWSPPKVSRAAGGRP